MFDLDAAKPEVVAPLPAAFEAAVQPIFRGSLSSGQASGLRRLLDGTAALSTDFRAYILATVYHETARTMQPIPEDGRGAGHPYVPYYGRGLAQITWKYNYARFGTLLGVDLVSAPDRALGWDVALPVLIQGMTRGLFTGRALPHYFGPLSYGTRCNPIDARAIVNGSDCATLIAGYFREFREALGNLGPLDGPAPSVIVASNFRV